MLNFLIISCSIVIASYCVLWARRHKGWRFAVATIAAVLMLGYAYLLLMGLNTPCEGLEGDRAKVCFAEFIAQEPEIY